MKKLTTNSLLIILTAIAFLGCAKDDSIDNEIPYYTFQPQDYPFLLDSYKETSKHLVFKNQQGEELSFHFGSFTEKKEDYTVSGGFGPPTSGGVGYYYDTRTFVYNSDQIAGNFSELQIQFNRYKDSLHGGITFPLWNVGTSFPNAASIPFTGAFDMTIDGFTYKEVKKINSGSMEIEEPNGGFDRNVNILYYDSTYGLIGFDALNGEEWRLQTP